MNNSRRAFIRNSSLVVGGTMAFSNEVFAVKKTKQIVGLQLYSVRDDMKKDPLNTLKQLAAMGYKNVEHANYIDRKFYGYTATEFKKILDDLGLKMPSGHTVMRPKHWDEVTKDFTAEWKYTVEDAKMVGQRYVITPSFDESLRKNYDSLMSLLDKFNKAGELCKKMGLKFGYHNHDFEFKYSLNDKKIYDIILEHTDPSLVAQQIDIGNMLEAGGMALEIMKKYPGRFESIHIKDEVKSENKGEMNGDLESTILGKGLVPVKQILDFARKSGGTKEFIIEQESYQGKTPLNCVKEDLAIMKSWGY